MKIYNTLSGQKEEFVPQDDQSVKMYVCGVTPYDYSHFGHAMSYTFFDVIRRYLIFRGYKVKYVQNVTDIDDKIINRANQRGITTAELAGKFTESFFADMKALHIMPADVNPLATQEIPKIIEVIQGLIEKGYAYKTPDGSVYFRVTKDADYGKLSHRTLDMMMAGARIEIGEEKEHPMDFAVWKASKPGEPSWDCPWGKGRPGWHIECTAMSLRYLGETLDIHGGGQDLIFPHHENEIAQSEGFTGKKPFVKYWMHNGFLQVGQEKMSKSLGNMLTIKDVLSKHSPDAIRVFILSSHYRSPLSLSEEGLEGAEKGSERLARAANRADNSSATSIFDASAYRQQFIEAMDDDFNSAKAIGILFDLARDINQAADSGRGIAEAGKTLKKLAGDVMGLKLPMAEAKAESVEATAIRDFHKAFISKMRREKLDRLVEKVGAAIDNPDVNIKDVVPYINWLIAIRSELRKDKKFQLADEIRTKLADMGIILEDIPGVTTWKSKK
jgi:cysteinyl-tRNA synthetase